MSEEEHNPWIGRAVRFFCGAAFGALVGLGWVSSDSTDPSWTPVLAAAILFGIAAALLKDEFWAHLYWW